MPVHRSTAYAFAPTWDGRKLPWELGRPEVRDILAELSDSEAVSSTRYSVSPTPEGLVGSLTGGQLERLYPQQPEQPASPTPEPVRAASRRRGREPVCTCGDCLPDMPTWVEQKCCMDVDLSSTHLNFRRECVYHCKVIKNFFIVLLKICWLPQRHYLHMTRNELNFRHMTDDN